MTFGAVSPFTPTLIYTPVLAALRSLAYTPRCRLASPRPIVLEFRGRFLGSRVHGFQKKPRQLQTGRPAVLTTEAAGPVSRHLVSGPVCCPAAGP